MIAERKGNERANSKTIERWSAYLDELHSRIARHFFRPEVEERAYRYLGGLVEDVRRKNSWQMAEASGYATLYRLQHLLGRANWDADELRDDLRGYVLERLGDDDAVLVVEETGFLKKGTESVGVKRQYTGTAGKTEDCQVGVFLCYASANKGQAFIDRELYLPEEWARDHERRQRGPRYRNRSVCAPRASWLKRCSGGRWMRG